MVAISSKLIQCESKATSTIFLHSITKFSFSRSNRKIIDTIPVPARYVSAPVFGGPDLNILFVTSAGLEVDFRTGEVGNQLAPPAGQLYQIQMDVQGIPTYLPRLD